MERVLYKAMAAASDCMVSTRMALSCPARLQLCRPGNAFMHERHGFGPVM